MKLMESYATHSLENSDLENPSDESSLLYIRSCTCSLAGVQFILGVYPAFPGDVLDGYFPVYHRVRTYG